MAPPAAHVDSGCALLTASPRWVLLLLHAMRGRADITLPDDCCRLVWLYGVQGWEAEHPGMCVDDDEGTVGVAAAYSRAAYPALWSRGVRLRPGDVLNLDFVLAQEHPARFDERYSVGLLERSLYQPVDYPVDFDAMGRLVSFELSGRVVFDDDAVVDLCEVDAAGVATVTLRVMVDERTVVVHVNREIIGSAKLPDCFDVSEHTLLYPFVVMNNGGDKALAVSGALTRADAPVEA